MWGAMSTLREGLDVAQETAKTAKAETAALAKSMVPQDSREESLEEVEKTADHPNSCFDAWPFLGMTQ